MNKTSKALIMATCTLLTLPGPGLQGELYSKIPGVEFIVYVVEKWAWIFPAYILIRFLTKFTRDRDAAELSDRELIVLVLIWTLGRMAVLFVLLNFFINGAGDALFEYVSLFIHNL